MVRLYTNENFPLPVVEELRRLGHDVLTTLESGKAGLAIPDAEMLAFAAKELRVLLTFNRRHFIRLHGDNSNHAGIVVCTFDTDFAGLGGRIHSALESMTSLAGNLIRVNRPG
ncbi:MAG: DUF5615 family PIN-like protein [Burkholderiales bacterium]